MWGTKRSSFQLTDHLAGYGAGIRLRGGDMDQAENIGAAKQLVHDPAWVSRWSF